MILCFETHVLIQNLQIYSTMSLNVFVFFNDKYLAFTLT